MELKNPWVGYLDRGYTQIKRAVVNRFRTLLPEVTDLSDSNIFMIILDYVASLVELLNYYIDNMARESYIYTAQHISSLVQQSRLIDYRMRPRVASTVDLIFSLYKDGKITHQTHNITIHKGTVVVGKGNIPFVTTRDRTISAGNVGVTIPAKQEERKVTVYLGTVGETLTLPTDYSHNSATLVINGVVWDEVPTLAFSHPTSRHFMVEYADRDDFYIKFGDGTHGAIPKPGDPIYITYQSTYGVMGNVEAGSITKIDQLLQTGLEDGFELKVTNPNPAVGGSDGESLEILREHLGASIRTLDRAVTYQDFIDLGKLCPGVDKVGLDFTCELGVIYYITSDGGGVASSTLMQRLSDFINPRKVMGIPVNVKPAGESYIRVSLKVWGRYSKRYEDIRDEVYEALVAEYSYENSDINRAINTSDIIALIDNLSSVDHLNLLDLTILPFPRQQVNTPISFPGVVDIISKDNLINREYAIMVSGKSDPVGDDDLGKVRITLAAENMETHELETVASSEYELKPESYNIEITYQDLKITMGIAQTLRIGYAWAFKTYLPDRDIPVDDNSVPVMRQQDITLEIIEQNYDSWKE